MSAAVARRHRALDRERANIQRHVGKKSSKQLRIAEGILDGQEELAARKLDALLKARQEGGLIVVESDRQATGGAGSNTSATPSPARRQVAALRHDRRRSAYKMSPVELFVMDLQAQMRAEDDHWLEQQQPEQQELPPLPTWFDTSWAAAIAALRSADGKLSRVVGHRPSIEELERDKAGGAAVAALTGLRDMRKAMRRLPTPRDEDGDDAAAAHVRGIRGSGGKLGGETTTHGGLFRGYSVELRRLRQQLSKATDAEGTSQKVQMLLLALSQRARADASVLAPPPLLPGVASLDDADPEHAQYIWLTERAQRMESLASAVAAAEADDTILVAQALEARRHRLDVALSLIVAEERRERLCENGQWEEVLEEWRAAGGRAAGVSGDEDNPGGSGVRPPPKLHLAHTGSLLRGTQGSSTGPSGAVAPAAAPAAAEGNTARSEGRDGGGSTWRTISARLPFLRSGAEMPWVDAVAKEYGLEYRARERAAGVAREMAAAGYTTAQARTVVLGMLHGTQAKLKAAWQVFVPGGDEAVLSRPEWRLVLTLITGGMGMSAEETDQLFSLFDQDGDGSLDYVEFCQVLDALPLQRNVQESTFGSALSAIQSLLVLRSSLLDRLSIEQLSAAGRIISRLKGAGFSDDDASVVIQAIFLSRSREALRGAWTVLRCAALRGARDPTSASTSVPTSNGPVRSSSAAGGGRATLTSAAQLEVDTIDVEGFRQLLPLLGEDLPLSRVERLFEEVDLDCSGTIDFDEFVSLVRRLKPRAASRNGHAASIAAFNSLTTQGPKRGRPRALRRAVPVPRRSEVGIMLLTLRDFGYDDEQSIGLLQALFPPDFSQAEEAEGPQSINETFHVSKVVAVGGDDASAKKDASNKVEQDLGVVRRGWLALGGGDLARMPVNPFDFRARVRRDGSGGDAKQTLIAHAERWQCAGGVDAVTFADLLSLLVETHPHLGGDWPRAVLAPLSSAMDNGEPTIGFGDFCTVICEMREALTAAAAAAAAAAADDANGTDTDGAGASRPLLALRGPGARRGSITDESFAEPMRRLAKREKASSDLRDHCPVPSWVITDLEALESIGKYSTKVAGQVRDGVELAVDKGVKLGEHLAPLLPLSKETRALIEPWHDEAIALCVGALRRSGFSSRHVDVLIRALYLAKGGGDVGADAVQSAWRVLRLHSERFASDEDAAAAAEGRGKKLLADDDDEEGLSIDETFRYDHHQLELHACRRMMWLVAAPLISRDRLLALFSAFDTNRDGAISFDELERLLRMLNPHRRLERLRPIDVPQLPSVFSQAFETVGKVAAPGVAMASAVWQRVNPLSNKTYDDDDDDSEAASFLVRTESFKKVR
jgi:Ca2+-binding EF-hand superfamily protein